MFMAAPARTNYAFFTAFFAGAAFLTAFFAGAAFFGAAFFAAAFLGAAFFTAFFVAIVVILPATHYETKIQKDKPKKLKNVSKCG
jgi:hypothetical protein